MDVIFICIFILVLFLASDSQRLSQVPDDAVRDVEAHAVRHVWTDGAALESARALVNLAKIEEKAGYKHGFYTVKLQRDIRCVPGMEDLFHIPSTKKSIYSKDEAWLFLMWARRHFRWNATYNVGHADLQDIEEQYHTTLTLSRCSLKIVANNYTKYMVPKPTQ